MSGRVVAAAAVDEGAEDVAVVAFMVAAEVIVPEGAVVVIVPVAAIRAAADLSRLARKVALLQVIPRHLAVQAVDRDQTWPRVRPAAIVRQRQIDRPVGIVLKPEIDRKWPIVRREERGLHSIIDRR